MPNLPSGTGTFLFTDRKGSAKLTREDPNGKNRLLLSDLFFHRTIAYSQATGPVLR